MTTDGSFRPISSAEAKARLHAARRRLQQTSSLQVMIRIQQEAELVKNEVNLANLDLDVRNFAMEVKMRAARKAGKWLMTRRLRGGDRSRTRRHVGLKGLHVTQNQSTRWQRIARISDLIFEEYLHSATVHRVALSMAGLIRFTNDRIDATSGSNCDSGCHPSDGNCPRLEVEIIKEMRAHLNAVLHMIDDSSKLEGENLGCLERSEFPRYIRELLLLVNELEDSLNNSDDESA